MCLGNEALIFLVKATAKSQKALVSVIFSFSFSYINVQCNTQPWYLGYVYVLKVFKKKLKKKLLFFKLFWCADVKNNFF